MAKYTQHKRYVVPVLPRINPQKLRVGEWIKHDSGVFLAVERLVRSNGRVKVIGAGVRGEPVEAWADECREAWDPDKHMNLAKRDVREGRKQKQSFDENGDPNGNVRD
jgi:hypothetical protein